MKPTFNKLVPAVAVLALLYTGANAQTQPADTTIQYLSKLAASQQQADKAILKEKLSALENSKDEKDLNNAISFYYRSQHPKEADSLANVALTRFPLGSHARGKEVQVIYDAKTGAEKETLYKKWLAKFPPSGYGEDQIVYDYALNSVTTTYAKEKNPAKVKVYADQLRVDFWKGNGYGGVAQTFYQNGDLPNAAIYYKKAVASAKEYYDGKLSELNSSKFAASGYVGLSTKLADILVTLKRYDEAKAILAQLKSDPKANSPQVNAMYAKALIGLGRYQEAYDHLEAAVKSGKASEEMINSFKDVYIKVKGSDAGYDQYAAQIRQSIIANLQQQLKKDIINTPAANFTLTDINGKSVTLADLKGKVVILDFWATWCGPCKASFPAMQMAVNKYKDDPNVKFLFIHTWEKVANPTQDAADYIKSQNYNFEVLMDLKNPETKINQVVTAYKVSGIPAKFVIDPNGNIRFHITGFSGGNQNAVDELTMMIDMAKKG